MTLLSEPHSLAIDLRPLTPHLSIHNPPCTVWKNMIAVWHTTLNLIYYPNLTLLDMKFMLSSVFFLDSMCACVLFCFLKPIIQFLVAFFDGCCFCLGMFRFMFIPFIYFMLCIYIYIIYLIICFFLFSCVICLFSCVSVIFGASKCDYVPPRTK